MKNQAEWDLVSRNSVLNMLEEKHAELLKNRRPGDLPIHEMWKNVLDMPPATIPPEIKRETVERGKWETENLFNGEYYEFSCHCSLCGCGGQANWDYCPFCGARMNG